LIGGLQGTLVILNFFQSTFLNQGCILIYSPLSFTPSLISGLGFKSYKIRCRALRLKNTGNSITPLTIFL
jgi:hypothetical protein